MNHLRMRGRIRSERRGGRRSGDIVTAAAIAAAGCAYVYAGVIVWRVLAP